MKVFLPMFLIAFGFSTIACISEKSAVAGVFAESTTNSRMTNETFPQTGKALPKLENPQLVIKKAERALEIYDGDRLVKTYKIALGFAPEGDKEREGDGKTPEGEFYIFTKNDRSKFYLSLGVSYPNIEDAKRGLKDELISQKEYDQIIKAVVEKRMPLQNTRLGGEIYIHGGGSVKDWTWGCAALENKDIKEIFDAVPVGASIKIES